MRPATLEDVEILIAERIAELEQRIAPSALSIPQVAERLDLSVSRVRELITTGALRSYRIGGARRVDPSDLAAFLAERRDSETVERRTAVQLGVSNKTWLDDLMSEAFRA